jgi:hypothetical protein
MKEIEIEEKKRRHVLEKEKKARNQQIARVAPEQAAQRLKSRNQKQKNKEQEDLELLITQQHSSIDAMHIARLLSPRFGKQLATKDNNKRTATEKNKELLKRHIPRDSPEEKRVQELLTSPRIGTFYH